MKPTLLVLAAGMGSRYGGVKQLDRVGPSGETIIDYSLYDAIRAGFGKVVFIIRRDIERDFRDLFIDKLSGSIEVDYVFQELDALPQGYSVPPERTKPWGTCHALLMADGVVKEPFAVINADDYYGVEAFSAVHDFLTEDRNDSSHALIGYRLGNTLSDHGDVNRGVCTVNRDGLLDGISEVRKISKSGGAIAAPDHKGGSLTFTGDEVVSMNLWGFKPSVFDLFRRELELFLDNSIDDKEAEIDIPTSIDKYIKSGDVTVKVIPTDSRWFGVTYREDRPYVVETLREMVTRGLYPSRLF